MATVPSSGTLSMKSMAQEALHGTYGSGTIVNPISLYDMTNGGNTNGSGDSYPTVNQACLPNPADRGYNELPLVKGAMGTGTPTTLYYNSSIGNASNLTVGDYLYTDSSLTTLAPSADFYASFQAGETGNSERHCDTGDDWYFDISGANGLINGDYGCS